MFGENITLFDGLIVCVFSMVVVFLVLWIITKTIAITAWVIRKGQKAPAAPARPVAPAAPTAPVAAAPAAAPAPSNVDAVVAAAAVAAYLGTSPDSFVVRSIRRAAPEESAWQQAGRLGDQL